MRSQGGTFTDSTRCVAFADSLFDGGVEMELGVAFQAQVAVLLPLGLLAAEEAGRASPRKESSPISGMSACSLKAWAMPESRRS